MLDTAEILRERATTAPQADDQPAGDREIAPPRTELGQVAAQTFGQSQAAIGRRVEAERQFAGEMRPRITAAREAQEALGREVAAKPPPVGPTIPPAPSRQLTDFLAVREGERPETSLFKLIQAMGLFATGASALSKKSARAGMAALTGAMKGWQAGDKERADRHFADWQAQTQTALRQWEIERTGYQDWFQAANLSVEQKMKGLQLDMLAHGVEIGPMELEQKGIEGALSYLTGREDAAQKLKMEFIKLETAKEYREEQRRFQVWLEDYKAQIARGERGEKREEALDKPIGSEASKYVDPQTGQPPKPTVTQRQLLEGGYVEASQKAREALAGIAQTEQILSDIGAYAGRLITAKTPAEAAAQYASLRTGALTGSNADARTYEAFKESFIGILSRTLGGERGVLTDRDIMRIRQGLPNFFDMVDTKNKKMTVIGNLLRTATAAQRRLLTGQSTEGLREELDRLTGQVPPPAPPPTGRPANNDPLGIRR